MYIHMYNGVDDNYAFLTNECMDLFAPVATSMPIIKILPVWTRTFTSVLDLLAGLLAPVKNPTMCKSF